MIKYYFVFINKKILKKCYSNCDNRKYYKDYDNNLNMKTKCNKLTAKTAEMNQMKEWYKNPVMILVLTFMGILPIGIIASLIGSLILKKKQLSFQS